MDSEEVRDHWADRSGEYSPEYYAHYGPDETSETLLEIFDRHLGRDASVLELGCSSGRHLAHLHEHGYDDLSGIEVNEDAFDVMAEVYPDLADAGEFYPAAIEDVVADFADDSFDAVYSVETLQHVHPDAGWVLEELVRVAGDLLVTVENEGGDASQAAGSDVNYVNDDFPLYYRDWHDVFTGLGLEEIHAETGDRDTVRAFRVPRDLTAH